jgi:hypothetical protein
MFHHVDAPGVVVNGGAARHVNARAAAAIPGDAVESTANEDAPFQRKLAKYPGRALERQGITMDVGAERPSA